VSNKTDKWLKKSLILPKAIKYRLKTLKEVPIIVWGRENFQRLPNRWRKLGWGWLTGRKGA
jgi:hypothetical protein